LIRSKASIQTPRIILPNISPIYTAAPKRPSVA